MTRSLGRIAFALVAWLFLIAIVVQVFLAGVGLFVPGVDMFAYHRQLGWLLHGGPIPVVLLAWAAGADRRTMWLSGALLVLVIIQPFLPGMRVALPFAAALHPVNALAIFWLAAAIARRSLSLAMNQPYPADAAREHSAAATEAPVSH
jgi:hypothetical protein